MTIEDTWGSDITTAAIAHLAHSTPESFRVTSTDFNSYNTISNALGAPQRESGFMRTNDEPGLGVQPRLDVLGKVVWEVSRHGHRVEPASSHRSARQTNVHCESELTSLADGNRNHANY